MLWGSNAREAHPICFHHVLKAVHRGAQLVVVDPRRTGSAQWADAGSGSTSAPTSRWPTPWAARSSRAGPREPGVHRARRDGVRGVPRRRGAVHARATPSARRASRPTRSASRRTPTRRPSRADLLDARHHGAPQRRRQRLRAHQPGAVDRPRGALRLGPQPAARAEQRPGRRRHGRAAEQAPRLPAHRDRRVPREVRARLGRAIPPKQGLAPVGDVRGDGARASCSALYVLGENPVQSEADQARAGICSRGSTTSSCRTSSSRDGRDGRRRVPGRGRAGASPRGP